MKPSTREWLVLAGLAVLALLGGMAGGIAGAAVSTAAVLYGARQLWITRALALALRRKRPLEPPFPGGRWREIFAAVCTLQRRSRARKRRIKRFVSRFRDAAAALPDAVVILGREDRLVWRNPAAAALFGLEARTCIGTPVTELVRDTLLAGYLEGADFGRPLEMSAPRDASILLSVSVTLFGPRRQRLLMAKDITRAYHLDQTRKDFVANVSHELRTPLTVLAGNLEMLEETKTGGETARRAIVSMQENVDRMATLVEDLLALSRLEMDRAPVGEATVDVPALLESILGDAQVLARETRHVLKLEAEPGLHLRGRAGELRSAFANLVNNAIRHTPPRTPVTVRWLGDGAGARLIVRDKGAGIPRRHLSRLTERFYRVDASRSTLTGGTGLGLAIVKHVLELHEATLSVSSREGAGTTFECHFPSNRVEEPHEGAQGSPGEPGETL